MRTYKELVDDFGDEIPELIDQTCNHNDSQLSAGPQQDSSRWRCGL